ncbi:MAG: DUF2796 domain-containing protein [Pseudomonadota bacterium]
MSQLPSNLRSLLSARWLMATASATALITLSACSPAAETSDETVSVAAETEVAETVAEVTDRAEATAEDMADEMSETVEAIEDVSEVRQAGSHVHGVANLSMALDGTTLAVELESPLYNLIGFEHTPEDDAQRAAVATAEAALSDASTLFTFTPDAGCAAESTDPVKLFPTDDQDHSDHEHSEHSHDHDHHDDSHSHDHDDHDHDHGDHDHEEHAHDHDGHDHEGHDHAHKDAMLTYSFVCERPDSLTWMGTSLFDAFDNLETVDFVYLGPDTQMSETLTGSSGRVQLAN